MQNVVRYYRHTITSQSPWTKAIYSQLQLTLHYQRHARPRIGSVVHYRGAKSKSTVKFEELPQGVLEPALSTAEHDDEGPAYPTVIRQARNNMRKYDNCVVLTRVGSFYEVWHLTISPNLPILMLFTAVFRASC